MNSANNKLPQRKRPTHMTPLERHNQPIVLFITIAAQPRGDYLANDIFCKIFREASKSADFWHVGRYVIMPDHIHFFCTPAKHPRVAVTQWVQYLKRCITIQLQNMQSTQDNSSIPWCWQSGCWDRQIRNAEHYHQKWEYMRANPVRRGLVNSADDWPYQGKLNLIAW